jgi:hypothetical protein
VSIERIVGRVGDHVGDLSDGHERWRIYRLAVDLPEAWADLLDAVRHEADPTIASAVAVQLLEVVPPEMRGAVVDVLDKGKGHDFAATRSKELGIMDELLAGRYDAKIARAQVDSWSTWLQLRAVSQVANEEILAELSKSGRTKRVRYVASRRMRSPGTGPSRIQ